MMGCFLALGLERVELVLQGLDLFLQRGLAPYERLDMLRLNGLLKAHGSELGQASGERAGGRADLSVEAAIIGVDDPYGVGNDLGAIIDQAVQGEVLTGILE